MTEVEKRIVAVLDKTRFILQADGGDLEYIKFEDGIVYVKMQGACAHCSSMSVTLYDGIESILLAEVPEVIGVEAI